MVKFVYKKENVFCTYSSFRAKAGLIHEAQVDNLVRGSFEEKVADPDPIANP